MFELYSVRNSLDKTTDVYEYNEFSQKLRTQIKIIFRKYIIDEVYCLVPLMKFHEMEIGEILFSYLPTPSNEYENYIMYCSTEELIDFLDILAYFLHHFDEFVGGGDIHLHLYQVRYKVVEELNHRLKQAHLGYEIINGKVLRIDNDLIHSHIAKPALHFLRTNDFKGAEEEAFIAFRSYMDDNYEDTVTYSAKAFESTMKTICINMDYKTFEHKDTAKTLINILFTEGFIPDYLSSYFSGLRSTLEGGLPTIRNRNGGHGQGRDIQKVPPELASYALHLMCTNILFLANLYERHKHE